MKLSDRFQDRDLRAVLDATNEQRKGWRKRALAAEAEVARLSAALRGHHPAEDWGDNCALCQLVNVGALPTGATEHGDST